MTGATVNDEIFIQMALQEAKRSVPEDNRVHPKVGVVVVKNGEVLAVAHRGEHIEGVDTRGNHAEFIALDTKLEPATLQGATIYTTLEPCIVRPVITPKCLAQGDLWNDVLPEW